MNIRAVNVAVAMLSPLLFLLSCITAVKNILPIGPKLEVTTYNTPSTVESVEPSEIVVYTGVENLPQGFFYGVSRVNDSQTLHAVSRFPSNLKSQMVLAKIEYYPELTGDTDDPESVLEAMKDNAASLGANGLFFPVKSSIHSYAIIVHPNTGAHSANYKDLLQREIGKQSEFKPIGPPTRHKLAAAQFDITVETGKCYLLAVAFERLNSLNSSTLTKMKLKVTSKDFAIKSKSFIPREEIGVISGISLRAPSHGKYVGLHSFSTPIGCATRDGDATVEITNNSEMTYLGDGSFWVHVLRN